MFFDLSKLLGPLVVPSNMVLAAGLVGLFLLLTRFAALLGMRLLVTGNLLFVAIGMSPLGCALMLPLEERFPRWEVSRGAPAGIIVLGGAIDPELSVARGEIALHEGAERVTVIADLARRFPTVPIVFSGGNGSLNSTSPAEADFAARLFESFGIPSERILRESHSRNTAENARFSRILVNPKLDERWLLVTSAAHMPRAVGTFRKASFSVEAYPVDWQTRGRQDLLSLLASPLEGWVLCDAAAHEWVGLLAYWVSGRTSALFPGP
jgi:uncharacterized SAM-binding protein YcdF (DUF218 family)